jgi:hypothetical protein
MVCTMPFTCVASSSSRSRPAQAPGYAIYPYPTPDSVALNEATVAYTVHGLGGAGWDRGRR